MVARFRWLCSVLALAAMSAHAEERFGARRTLEAHEIARAVAKAPDGREPGVVLCDLGAYSSDKTRTNLRAGPSAGAKVIATLPPERHEAGTKIGPEFQVIAGKGAWFLIRGAYWNGYDLAEKALALGPAWMSAHLMGFTIWSIELRKEPRFDSEVVVAMVSPENVSPSWGPDSAKIERVFGCSGSYVDVAVLLPDGRKARGWASGLCPNQVTSCGGGGMQLEARAGGLFQPERICREYPDERLCPPEKR